MTDLPIVGHPTRLHVRVPSFTGDSPECDTRIFQQRMPLLAEPRAETTRRSTRRILQRLAIDRTSVSAVAEALGLGWDLVNELAISKIRTMVYDRPGHFDRVRVLAMGEHKWKHVRGDGSHSFVTVLVDLTPVVDGTGPARSSPWTGSPDSTWPPRRQSPRLGPSWTRSTSCIWRPRS